MLFHLAVVASSLCAVKAQGPEAKLQTSTFNSSAKLTSNQIGHARLDDATVKNIQIALRFEQSNWAGESVSQSFYTVPADSADMPFGSLLKKEDYTDTNYYTVPPNVALSRFLFQSETMNGTKVPASAYVLWPFVPRKFKDIKGVPVVAWGHGNSGFNGECAPSHIRNLWYQYNAPYDLVLAGYAVVAPDYAGLGVHKDAKGNHIYSQWLSGVPNGNDLIHAVQAARQGWPELSEEFVVFGHSQGGAAAWGAAQHQARNPIKGYLGTISASPVTNLSASADMSLHGLDPFLPGLAHSVKTVFPSFKLSDFLTETGMSRLKVLREIQGCNSAQNQILSVSGLAKDTYRNSTPYFDAYMKMAAVGGAKPYKGPMLVLQGTADSAVYAPGVTAQVQSTCKHHPKEDLHYIEFEGVDHVPVLYASQTIWQDWIADRFRGESVAHGCPKQLIKPLRKSEYYQQELNFFLEYAQWAYELA